MKVLIANPPAYIGDYDRHFVQAGSRWSFTMRISKDSGCNEHYLPYPFFLGYSSALLKRTFDVKAIDACALDFDEREFIQYVVAHDPDVLVLEVPTVSFPLVMEVIREIKEDIRCKVVLAGSHVTALAKEVMDKYAFIDYCLLGEYELTLKELMEHLDKESEDDKNLRAIKGLGFRHGNKVTINERRELLKNLDKLPFPDREDLPIKYYHDFEIAGKPSAQMLTSRGCPSSCIFCVERQVIWDSPLYRKRNPAKVVDEMALVKDEYGAKQVYFDDETMTINRKHVKAICDEIIYRGLDIPWTCMGDITLDYDTLNLMAKAGCVGVKFGVETVNTETLSEIRKIFLNLEKTKQFVEWCRELNMWSHATFMIGLPGDTEKDVSKTLKFATDLDPDSAQFSIATPFPGTPFFDMAKRNDWLTTLDWTMYDGANHAVLNYPWLSKEEIERLYQNALKKFYKHAILKGFVKPRRVVRLVRARGLGYAMRKALSASRT